MKILEDNQRKLHPHMENMKSVAKGLYTMFGENCEIIIHDLKKPESSIVLIAGTLTNRNLGSPVTDLVLRTVKENKTPENILNYTIKTKDNRTFKSSTLFIRDEKNKTIGCLCINYDVSDFMKTQDILNNFCGIPLPSKEEVQIKNKENFTNNITEMFENIFNEALEHIDKPLAKMNREDNIKVIKFLDEKGIFAVKNSVETIADYLKVSRYTIYNYLKEIK